MPRPRRPWAVALLLGGLLATGGVVAVAAAARPAVPPPTSAGTTTGACPGPRMVDPVHGILGSDDPYGTRPLPSNRTVLFAYEYQENASSPSGPLRSCATANATALTSSNGSFEIDAPVPALNCSGVHNCRVYSGPFGPVAFSVVGGDPAGDVLRVAWDGAGVRLTWTSALASAQVDPEGPVVLSVDDATRLNASLAAGDGSPSPANVSLTWRIGGGGWSLDGDTEAPNVTVDAGPLARAGEASLFVNGSYNGTSFPTLERSVELEAVATAIENSSLAPGAIDAGQSVDVTISGEGAPGYPYWANVTPGLGLAAVALRCTAPTANAPAPAVGVNCTGRWSYPEAGEAQPAATLTNGRSATVWSLPTIEIAAPLGVAVAPDPTQAYVNTTVPFRVSVAAGTGTGPYGPACLAPGTGALACTTTNGSSWTIDYAYPSPGDYSAVASVEDGAGVNRTLAFPVQVAAPPRLGAVEGCPEGPLNASSVWAPEAVLSGGLWPAEYWWNDSLPATTLDEGTRYADGPIPLAWAAEVPGEHLLTLTVIDALGTRVATSCAVEVDPGPAIALEPIGGPNVSTVVAGAPANVSFRAADALGTTVPDFAQPAEVEAIGPGSAATLSLVDAEGAVPLARNGTAELPPGAWDLGVLTLDFASNASGTWTLRVDAGVGAPASVTVPVSGDGDHPHLVDPQTALSSARAGATLWTVVDPFGNPVLDGYIVVRSEFPLGTVDADYPIRDRGGVGQVWVNYTALGGGAGVVLVLSASGEPLLAPIVVPASASGVPLSEYLLVALGALVVAAAAGFAALRGRRHRPRGNDAVDEPELARHAAGRDHLLGQLADGRPRSLAELGGDWRGPPPVPDRAELADWLSALVAEGAVTAASDAEGRPVFAAVAAPPPEPEVVLDEPALDRALSGREASSEDGPGP